MDQVRMNEELIFKELPSYKLLQLESVQALTRAETLHFLNIFGLEDNVKEDFDTEYLQSVLHTFISSFSNNNARIFHILYEMMAVFPELGFDFVQSLLESTGGIVTKEVVEECISLSCELNIDKDIIILTSSKLLHISTLRSAPIRLRKKSVLFVVDDGDCSKISMDNQQILGLAMTSSRGLNSLSGQMQSGEMLWEWGVHDLLVCVRSACSSRFILQGKEENQELRVVSTKIFVTSNIFDYASSLEKFFDLYYNGWVFDEKKGTWTSELEEAMLHLLIAIDDDFTEFVSSWMSMIKSTGVIQGVGSDLHNLLVMVQVDATDSLRTHSASAVCRLHQVLGQFIDISSSQMGSMVNIPQGFLQSIKNFILAKLKASKTSHLLIVECLSNLLSCAKRYRLDLMMKKQNSTNAKNIEHFVECFSSRIPILTSNQLISVEDKLLMSSFFDSLTLQDLTTFEILKPSQLDSFLHGSQESLYPNVETLNILPTLPIRVITSPESLNEAVACLAETTFNDAINLGSIGEVGIGGYTMTRENCATTCAIISSLLDVGIAYVATKDTAKLLGHFPMWRSTLRLQPTGGDQFLVIPTQLKKRIKDMKRIFRNKVNKKLSLRLNYNVNHAISLLRQHHGVECWVGEELERAWLLMTSTQPPQLMVFELYYGEDLVAADFAHPVCGGAAVYVATRFSARGHSKTSYHVENEDKSTIRTIQPGFILALSMSRWLQERNCLLVDYGGYNLSPLMQYKLDLTGYAQSRPEALYEFRNYIRKVNTPSSPWINATAEGASKQHECLFGPWEIGPDNVLIDDIRLDHLFGC